MKSFSLKLNHFKSHNNYLGQSRIAIENTECDTVLSLALRMYDLVRKSIHENAVVGPGGEPSCQENQPQGRLSTTLSCWKSETSIYQAYFTEAGFSYAQVSCFCLCVCVWKRKQRLWRKISQLFCTPISWGGGTWNIIKSGNIQLLICAIAPDFLTTLPFSHFFSFFFASVSIALTGILVSMRRKKYLKMYIYLQM